MVEYRKMYCALIVNINGTEISALCPGRLISKQERIVLQRRAVEEQEICS
jgi:hypothetical protein